MLYNVNYGNSVFLAGSKRTEGKPIQNAQWLPHGLTNNGLEWYGLKYSTTRYNHVGDCWFIFPMKISTHSFYTKREKILLYDFFLCIRHDPDIIFQHWTNIKEICNTDIFCCENFFSPLDEIELVMMESHSTILNQC